jgi:DNA mismatch repair protein MutL
MACRAAIMAGDPVDESQVAELLRRADLVDSRQGCAHGRPTALRIPFTDLERRFRR